MATKFESVRINSIKKLNRIMETFAREGRRGTYDKFYAFNGNSFCCIKTYYLVYYWTKA